MTRVAGSRVFVAGGTGVLGRVLVPALVARGHEVVGLARTPVAARSLRILGATPVEASLFDLVGLARAVDGADVVIHAATAIPSGARMRRRSAWALNDRIRTEGTRTLAIAAGLSGAGLLLQQSVA
ncbi:MAG TPA: NAD-dependent epimerase/dehydratase family protein, partial [Longimicrobiales bacterium]|nr:NAD-dependent epimerase/dehydratase family protein [Longimicrobiales bacterium]